MEGGWRRKDRGSVDVEGWREGGWCKDRGIVKGGGWMEEGQKEKEGSRVSRGRAET